MTKKKSDNKKPSRKRYESKHPTVSFRLDRETYDRLKRHLQGSNCSFADFVKDALGREQSMVKRRVEVLAAKKAEPSVEKRLRNLEELLSQVMITTQHPKMPWTCPCCGEILADALVAKEGEMHPTVFVHACPKCHFFLVPWLDTPNAASVSTLRFERKSS